MLKPIPQERPSNSGKRRTKKQTHFMRVEMSIRSFEKSDHQLFAHVGHQLMEYVKKAENISMKELSEMIHDLQRTVIGLQKKRLNIVRRQQRKKKQGS